MPLRMAGLSAASSGKGSIQDVRHQGQAGGGGGLHRVVLERRIQVEAFDAVLGSVLLHDRHGQDDGHVVGGFGGQDAARAQFPEIGVPGTLDRLFDIPGPQL